jgi:hypothetical protein
VNTSFVKPSNRLEEAEKHIRIVAASLSVLRQMNERLHLPTTNGVLEELVALARAQRRTLKAAQAQLEADPLFSHLLKSRIAYSRADETRTKLGKRMEELVCSTFFVAQGLRFRGDIHDWRKLLAIFPR